MLFVEESAKQICPECQKTLEFEAGIFHCGEHGDFFSYGSHLLVRAALPQEQTGSPEHLMPWEKMRDKMI